MAPVVKGDWLASVCPYLISEDGTYRSAAPDEGHRCVAVEPPATLPLAFQERFCLTERHPRCEMFKFAQEVGTDEGIPISATKLMAPATRSARSSGSTEGGGGSRPTILLAAGIGGLVIVVVLVVLLMSSCSSDPAPGSDSSPEPGATEQPRPEPTPARTPEPTAEPEPTPEPDPDATAVPTGEAGQEVIILYEVQEGEALLKVAETFGITRRRILRANPTLEEVTPADLPGTVIEIPVPASVSLDELEALPGYQGPLP